ncbi:MAG: helix-turn-helix transcriptional regulator [Terriglobales bacterium]|jgi:transcriptional regulator with XRE-family HTH domain
MSKRPTIKKPPLDFGGETLGERLARFRKQRGYTQAELAQKVGIGQVLVSAYETDRRQFSAQMAVRFALALDVSMDEFLHPKAKRAVTKKPNRRVLRRMEKIESLPFHQQTHLLKTIDGFLKGVGVAF